jgi:hypothetical protein
MAKDPLFQMLADPERTPIRGALPVVTVRPDDEPEYIDAVRRMESERIDLERRGRDHGTVVELLRPDLSPKLDTRQMQACWKAADPFVIRDAAPKADDATAMLPEGWAASTDERARWERWIVEHASEAIECTDAFIDPDRDIAKAVCERRGAWAKLGRLSTTEGDASRRLAFGVGEEFRDDDHPSEERHADVWAWACSLLPALEASWPDTLRKCLGGASGRPLVPSNPIVYWNRPNGGALFHHDALPGYLPVEDTESAEPPPSGQRGVVYVQGSGSTVWLALSIQQLAERCCEFMRDVVDGGAPWLFDTWVKEGVWQPLFFATRELEPCLRALARSDAGPLRPLVHGCLEFTGLLCDSGHAAVLRAGDAIALPNHGLDRTAMHSVYCGSSGPNVGFSLGLR